MFLCGSCHKAIGPGIRPVMITTLDRAASYTRVVDGETKTSWGSEIVREIKACPICAGVSVTADSAPARDYSTDAKSRQQHAAKCVGDRKPLDECFVCRRNMEAFAQYPLGALNKALSEPKVPPIYKVSMACALVEALMKRAEHKTKRSERDFQAGFAILKTYELSGGGL